MVYHQLRYDIIIGVMTSSVALWHHQWCFGTSWIVLSNIITGVMTNHQWCYHTSSLALFWTMTFPIIPEFSHEKKAISGALYKLKKFPISTARLAFHLPSVTNIKPFGEFSWNSVQGVSFHNRSSTRREFRADQLTDTHILSNDLQYFCSHFTHSSAKLCQRRTYRRRKAELFLKL